MGVVLLELSSLGDSDGNGIGGRWLLKEACGGSCEDGGGCSAPLWGDDVIGLWSRVATPLM